MSQQSVALVCFSHSACVTRSVGRQPSVGTLERTESVSVQQELAQDQARFKAQPQHAPT